MDTQRGTELDGPITESIEVRQEFKRCGSGGDDIDGRR